MIDWKWSQCDGDPLLERSRKLGSRNQERRRWEINKVGREEKKKVEERRGKNEKGK